MRILNADKAFIVGVCCSVEIDVMPERTIVLSYLSCRSALSPSPYDLTLLISIDTCVYAETTEYSQQTHCE